MTNLANLPAYVFEIEEEVLRCVFENGIDSTKAEKLAKSICKALSHRWGGLSIYFLKGFSKRQKIREKHAQIIAEYDGTNAAALATKHDVTTQWIYKIIKDYRK